MLAVQTGADAIGMIFAESPRRISMEAALEIAAVLPPFITPVGVFVEPSWDEIANVRAIFPDLVIQLHGDESPAFASSLDAKVIKTIRVSPDGADQAELERQVHLHPRAIALFDTAAHGLLGGSGKTFPWRLVGPIARERQVIVGGGLTPENVSNCVRTVRPYGIDVRSGIETDGRKDPLKMRAFVQAVKDTDVA